jgi:hypothetical protein
MKSIMVQRKYGIYSSFLDTTIQAEDELLPGESIEDGILRIHAQLESTAARLRKEAMPHLHQEDSTERVFGPPLSVNHSAVSEKLKEYVIDYKQTEQLEIAIDNATSPEQLAEIKESCGKAGLVGAYMKKLNQLTTKL